METLVLPPQDQLSQHQYWKRTSVMDLFSSPRYPKQQRHPPSPSSPVPRSILRTNSAIDLSVLSPSPAPLSRTSSDAARPAHRRASPVKNSKATGKGGKANKNRENVAAPQKVKFVKKAPPKKDEALPKITILQRPSSKEAAMLDLAKITGLPLSEVYAKNGMSVPEHAAGNHPVVKVVKNRQHDGAAKASTRSVKVAAAAAAQPVAVTNAAATDKKKDGGKRDDEKVVPKDERKEVAKESKRRTAAMITLFDEKWAGPAFTNSPPPSCLPIPNFSVRKPETLVSQAEFAKVMDTEAATRGLRRILNLDF